MHGAGELRHEPTPAEAKLWAYLRASKLEGVKFRRQHAIGRYVVDFCSPSQKLIIELDGSQHLQEHEPDARPRFPLEAGWAMAARRRLARRTEFLESQGYRVLRFWNDMVMNDIEGVMRAIEGALKEA
jgi:very-short-patch-repair endonuclease